MSLEQRLGAWALALTWCLATESAAQVFTEEPASGLIGVHLSTASWGDFDADGDLDLLLTGRDNSLTATARLFRNDGTGVFTLLGTGLVGIEFGASAWADYDNDGDIDLVLAGQDDLETPITRLYRNDSGSFTNVATGIVGVENGAVAWGDYDNDGDLDLLVCGRLASDVPSTKLYRKDPASFTEVSTGFTALENSTAAWGDYDRDGDLDLLLTGLDASATRRSRIYRNDAGAFTDVNAGLTGIERGAAAWCDFDLDGDLDLALAGSSDSGNITKLYRNDGVGGFVDLGAAIVGLQSGSMDWGDYDNDGDADLLLTGFDNTLTRISRIYRNDGSSFLDAAESLASVRSGVARWGDFDADGDLDIVLTGQDASGMAVAKAYRNGTAAANTAPAMPQDLAVQLVGTTVTFSWSAAADSQTASGALSYNLRVGSTAGGSEIVSAMADAASGRLRVVRPGNAGTGLSWTVKLPSLGTYYWTIQAVDAGFQASAFAPEYSFATSFSDIANQIQGVSGGAVSWGDYDADGDMDLVVTGMASGSRVARIYRNDGTGFTQSASLEGVDQSAVAWGDYDRDNDLDLLIAGYSASYGRITRIYRNSGGSFTDISAGLEGVYRGSVAWGDYDNDGDLDIALCGNSNCCGRITRIYRNNGTTFSDIGASIEGLEYGSITWGDYDRDGDLDLLMSGTSNCCSQITRIYRNTGTSFSDVGAGIVGVSAGSATWGDYNSDGHLDVLVSGMSSCCGRITRVYRSNGGTSFTDVSASLDGIDNGMAAWFDHDSDGDLDVVMTGQGTSAALTRVYRNQGGLFSDTVAGLEALSQSTLALGDVDGDRDLDLVVIGLNASSAPTAKLYRNNATNTNAPPSVPSALAVQASGMTATLSWAASNDDWTPTASLTYNVRVGTTPGGSDIMSAMADASTGLRRVAARGNAGEELTWTLKLPALGGYYWSVQAIDGSEVGSGFAPEQSFFTAFSTVAANLDGVYDSAVAWGDYDNDGDLDLLLAGYSSVYGNITRLCRNDNGNFISVSTGLESVRYASVAWGDYDNDGDLDVLLLGASNCCGRIARVYRNNGGSFSDIGANLDGVEQGYGEWGDYDNDGDLDILLSGYANCCGPMTRIYRNNGGGSFTATVSLPGTYRGTVSWGDYDNDGDLDILLTGYGHYANVYRNNGSDSFSDIGAGLPGVYDSSASWGDYDNDGDLDILLTGAGPYTEVFRNSGGSFSSIGAGMTGVYAGKASWGDYDNDGDLDALIAGYSNSFGPITRVYRNQSGTFVDAALALEGMNPSAASWGDYDNDGDLDLVVTGNTSTSTTRLYRNNVASAPNAPPAAPVDLQVQVVGARANLTWDAPSDDTTPAAGLTYSLRIGTSPGGSEIMVPLADSATGYRRVARRGPGGSNRTWSLSLSAVPVTSTLYFAVQAIDHAYAGSPFSSEAIFSGAPIIQSILDVPNDQGRQVRIRWQRSIYDSPGSSTVITGYGIWRLVTTAANAPEGRQSKASPPLRRRLHGADWDYVLTVPARANQNYSVIAPTLCDSTVAGVCFSTFFVSAMTAVPSVYFDSAPTQGYSIDNLAPSAPQELIVSAQGPGAAFLQWAQVQDADLDYYSIYRDIVSGFVPNGGNRVGYSTGDNYQDASIPGPGVYYYKVTASDFSGNEGLPSAERSVEIGTPSDAPLLVNRLQLHPNQPNPFNPTTRVSFDLPEPAHVRLEIFDPSGSLIATLTDRDWPAGAHYLEWNGLGRTGKRLPSGQYLCRMTTSGFSATRKMTLVQ